MQEVVVDYDEMEVSGRSRAQSEVERIAQLIVRVATNPIERRMGAPLDVIWTSADCLWQVVYAEGKFIGFRLKHPRGDFESPSPEACTMPYWLVQGHLYHLAEALAREFPELEEHLDAEKLFMNS